MKKLICLIWGCQTNSVIIVTEPSGWADSGDRFWHIFRFYLLNC